MSTKTQFNQIYWHCRRGMWELDLYLIPFVRERYGELTESEQASFVTLLELPDVELHACLTGYSVAANPLLNNIIALVSEYAQQSDKTSVF
jgi:antitoxin CptB